MKFASMWFIRNFIKIILINSSELPKGKIFRRTNFCHHIFIYRISYEKKHASELKKRRLDCTDPKYGLALELLNYGIPGRGLVTLYRQWSSQRTDRTESKMDTLDKIVGQSHLLQRVRDLIRHKHYSIRCRTGLLGLDQAIYSLPRQMVSP